MEQKGKLSLDLQRKSFIYFLKFSLLPGCSLPVGRKCFRFRLLFLWFPLLVLVLLVDLTFELVSRGRFLKRVREIQSNFQKILTLFGAATSQNP